MKKQTTNDLIIEDKITDKIQRQINNNKDQQINTRYNNNQILSIVNFILNLKDYYKIVSLNIQHHQNSMNTLPLPILTQFPQLTKRGELIIDKSKFNVKFINQIIEPYNQLVYLHLLQKNKQENKQIYVTDNCHNHHNYHQNHTLIMNIFYHVIREWSLPSNLNYFQIIISHIQSYLSHQKENNVNQYQNTKILIVQCGMGRILKQLRKRFKQDKIFIQGHQSQVQLYLCAEYILNRCREQSQVYPYIHNFANFLNSQDPYRKIVIPFQIESDIIIYPLTFGPFTKIYRKHLQNWNIIVTLFNNYNIKDILLHVKLIDRMLTKGGIWIDLCTASFDKNVVPMTYRQYQFILDNFKFELLAAGKCNDFWFHDNQCLLNQKRVCYYRVMKK